MENVLQEFASVPGLTGAYIYQLPGAILENTLPALFKPARLLAMGKQLSKVHAAGAMTLQEVSDVVLAYDESTVMARPIAEKAWLVLLGAPDLNVHLATLTVNLLMDDLKSFLESPAAQERARPQALEAPAPGPATGARAPLTPRDLMERGSLAPALLGMQSALAKVMGPMAKIVFTECLEKWLQLNEPSKDNLGSLLNLVLREIDDPEKAARYRNMVEALP
ncbi:MAG: hypothetical protein HY823_00845 [Acidobacteria bacterium]|nr:hypothetical protein [Acidobacteriota bacterium]